jgi:hypothetical protein
MVLMFKIAHFPRFLKGFTSCPLFKFEYSQTQLASPGHYAHNTVGECKGDSSPANALFSPVAWNFARQRLVCRSGGYMRNIFLFLGVLAISIASCAQAETRPEILVFGTYDISNPGHDIHNMQADDVLSPKRQQEIAQLIEVLKRFHRTKIAIEADVGSKPVEQEYSDYRAGKYTGFGTRLRRQNSRRPLARSRRYTRPH